MKKSKNNQEDDNELLFRENCRMMNENLIYFCGKWEKLVSNHYSTAYLSSVNHYGSETRSLTHDLALSSVLAYMVKSIDSFLVRFLT